MIFQREKGHFTIRGKNERLTFQLISFATGTETEEPAVCVRAGGKAAFQCVGVPYEFP